MVFSRTSPAQREPPACIRLLFEAMISGGTVADPDALGAAYEALLAAGERRRSGVHYTPPALADEVVARTLGPLLEGADEDADAARPHDPPSSSRILALRICDPAAGTGALLLAAGRFLASSLAAAWQRERTAESRVADPMGLARDRVVSECLFGVDQDPAAATVARWALTLLGRRSDPDPTFLDRAIVVGDSLELPAADAGAEAFAWERAWPERFAAASPGFDALVVNPPFLGGKRIRTELGVSGREALDRRFPDVPGSVDLCVHFLRLADRLLGDGGFFGFILPRAAVEGVSRLHGLGWLLGQGFRLYDAHSHVAWPSAGAGVVVCTVHGCRLPRRPPASLDGRPVPAISSFLRDEEESAPVGRLKANEGIVFGGCKLDGRGFVLQPEEARALVDADPRNALRIRPFLGGEELNQLPDLGFCRHVIDFGRETFEEAGAWPLLLARLETTVRSQRLGHGEDRARACWWQFQRCRPELERALVGLDRCLACSMVSNSLLFAFQPTDRVFSHKLAIFATNSWAVFALLQSRLHEGWSRRFASSRGAALNYAPTACFLTFPFPWKGGPGAGEALGHDAVLARAGQRFYEERSACMMARGQGMAAIWRRMLDPSEVDADLLRLRSLRDEMDAAVLASYGWGELEPGDATATTRLLALNRERVLAEQPFQCAQAWLDFGASRRSR
jgi:hypothetical protein